MDERQRLFRIHGELGSYEGLIRLYETFEGRPVLDVTIDVTNESHGRKRILDKRNDKLPRLPGEVLEELQNSLITACMADLEKGETKIAESVETQKIGFRMFLEYHEKEKALEELAKPVIPDE